jgi:phosphoglycolate phosphatase-like HAD superfamily hydrolase
MSALPRVLALDFDGVICDGMPEYFESSLRAHRASLGGAPDPSHRQELFARFAALRPAVETGWEMVVLVDMLAERDAAGDGELRQRWAAVRDGWVARKGIEPKKLADALDSVRDAWVREDLSGWLAKHSFFPGMTAWLRQLCESGQIWYVVTTKEARFNVALLEWQQVPMARERVIGKQWPKREKWEVLRELAARHGLPPTGEGLWFVEDRFETLRGLHERARDLSAVRLYLADWGYIFPERDLVEAARHDRIQRIGLGDVQAGLGTWPDPYFGGR